MSAAKVPGFSRPTHAILQEAAVDPAEGLASEEAARRRERHGPNRLREVERRSLWQILWNQASLILLLLVVAGGVAWTFGQPVEALAVAVVVVINQLFHAFDTARL